MPEIQTGCGPHEFAPLKERRWWQVWRPTDDRFDACSHCYWPKWVHPIPFWAKARPLADTTPASFHAEEIPEGICPECGHDVRRGSSHGRGCRYWHFRPHRPTDQPKDCGGSGFRHVHDDGDTVTGEGRCPGCSHPDCPNRDQPKGGR